MGNTDVVIFNSVYRFPRCCSHCLLDASPSPQCVILLMFTFLIAEIASTTLWISRVKISPSSYVLYGLPCMTDLLALWRRARELNLKNSSEKRAVPLQRDLGHSIQSGATHGKVVLLINFCVQQMYDFKLISLLLTHRNLFHTLSHICTRA